MAAKPDGDSTTRFQHRRRPSYSWAVSTLIPEELDLNELRAQLQQRFGDLPPVGYVEGKTTLRAAVVDILQCSELEAEQLVDTLETRGIIQYEGDQSHEVDNLVARWLLDAS